MKIAVTSDLFNGLFDLQEGVDLFVVCGNICPIWSKNDISYNISKQAEWIENELNPWLSRINTDNILLIGGPNDFAAQHYGSHFSFYLNGNYIQDEPMTFGGKVFYGMPWIPSHYVLPEDRCAFKSRSGDLFNVALESINKNIDILLTYVAPRTGMDGDNPNGLHRGDLFLNNKISDIENLSLCIYGMASCEKDTNIVKRSRTGSSPYRVFEI